MEFTHSSAAESVLLQRSIAATLWRVRKATAAHDELAAHRHERDLETLLDRLAACLVGDQGVARPEVAAAGA